MHERKSWEVGTLDVGLRNLDFNYPGSGELVEVSDSDFKKKLRQIDQQRFVE